MKRRRTNSTSSSDEEPSQSAPGPSTSNPPALQREENAGNRSTAPRRSTRACVLSRSVPYFPARRGAKRMRMDSYHKRVSQWLGQNFQESDQHGHLTPLHRQSLQSLQSLHSTGEGNAEGGASEPSGSMDVDEEVPPSTTETSDADTVPDKKNN